MIRNIAGFIAFVVLTLVLIACEYEAASAIYDRNHKDIPPAIVVCDPTGHANGSPAPCLPAHEHATVTADPGACTADYRDGAWHICDVTVPAATEDTYRVEYRNGAWHLTYSSG